MYQDAEFVDNLVADFSATAEELTASIQEMTKVTEEIAVAAHSVNWVKFNALKWSEQS